MLKLHRIKEIGSWLASRNVAIIAVFASVSQTTPTSAWAVATIPVPSSALVSRASPNGVVFIMTRKFQNLLIVSWKCIGGNNDSQYDQNGFHL